MDQSVPPGRVRGICIPPCSKSYAQRALAASLLAEGTSRLHNIEFCDDTRSAIRCIEALGARVRRTGERTLEIDGGLSPAGDRLYVGQSGLSTRLFTPIASLCDTPIGVVGEGPLLHRSFRTMIRTLRALGVRVHDRNDHLPLHIQGPIRGGEVQIEGLVSSQFITGLMFALPLCEEDSVIKLTSPLQSKPYADMTIAALKNFGINIYETKLGGLPMYLIKGGQKYSPCRVSVEGDYSQAAFFFTANALGSEIRVKNLIPDSVQGDKAIVDIIEKSSTGDGLEPFTVDVGDIPDLVPILAVLGCFTKGTSRIVNAARLKIKESDRITAIADALNAIGGKVTAGDDFLEMQHVDRFTGGEVDPCNDHRIVMAAAIAATASDAPVIIRGAEAVNKSYPRFFEDFKALGGEFEVL